ncbi:hypothetical protein L195_g045218 [Trifolium pratense]|uniref:Uncharacterized protein n=1 Tax=Trifolium pratense TaxID=57577 RepID=A0A2K3ME85_TRIPR|nr:hypothetical protein L195_g045218 [Trifolium pratense]
MLRQTDAKSHCKGSVHLQAHAPRSPAQPAPPHHAPHAHALRPAAPSDAVETLHA